MNVLGNSGLENAIAESHKNIQQNDASCWFKSLIQPEQYVGELFSINYESAKVQIHDSERYKVGGIPSHCFLIASRVNVASDDIDFRKEDSSIILLRVKDSTPLPHDRDAERIRIETAQRISGSTDIHWDYKDAMDAKTRVMLGFAGVECRIIGTFYLEEEDSNNPESRLHLRFGCDISNYYPNRGLKVYKPNGKALEEIINYVTPESKKGHIKQFGSSGKVKLGTVRYASTNRKYQNVDNVPFHIYPADLLSQKTALFGMTRTGKSNTTKIIAKSVYELRYPKSPSDRPLRIGQIIFDPNGEYANENVQDAGGDNPNALKNVWKIHRGADKATEVVTYGITKHPDDPDRKLMLLNFHLDDNLQIGKEIINSMLEGEGVKYISNFRQVSFDNAPSKEERGNYVRYQRRVLVYRAILTQAGFPPSSKTVSIRGKFSKELCQHLKATEDPEYQSAANCLSQDSVTWDGLYRALQSLDKFIRENHNEYKKFENWYINERPSASGDSWADEELKKVLGILQYPNGVRIIGNAAPQHTSETNSDYANDIYNDLVAGKLVIIDQSTGDTTINNASARRIMSMIFERNKELFIQGKPLKDILVYAEEAHNLLPSDTEKDYTDIWVRTAKEGAKLHIGLVYITQEVSSIQKNILKNTANWFICHLNNSDETRELCKFYDFKDFEHSILRAQDKGFVRVKTLSNFFVVPVQVKRFDVTEES